jgi:hypothetical protein
MPDDACRDVRARIVQRATPREADRRFRAASQPWRRCGRPLTSPVRQAIGSTLSATTPWLDSGGESTSLPQSFFCVIAFAGASLPPIRPRHAEYSSQAFLPRGPAALFFPRQHPANNIATSVEQHSDIRRGQAPVRGAVASGEMSMKVRGFSVAQGPPFVAIRPHVLALFYQTGVTSVHGEQSHSRARPRGPIQ